MPQASEEDRQWARDMFGDISDAPVIHELEQRRFTLGKDWCWYRSRSPNPFEWKCINFLIDEWDFGGYSED